MHVLHIWIFVLLCLWSAQGFDYHYGKKIKKAKNFRSDVIYQMSKETKLLTN